MFIPLMFPGRYGQHLCRRSAVRPVLGPVLVGAVLEPVLVGVGAMVVVVVVVGGGAADTLSNLEIS